MDSLDQQVITQERIKSLINGSFPFNPVSGSEIHGQNLYRLQQAMEMFGWKDPRFVTMEESELNGWNIKENATSISILVRDRKYGTVQEMKVFNASNIEGIPSLQEMVTMSNDELNIIQTRGKAFDELEEFGDEVLIVPAMELKRDEVNEQPLPAAPVVNKDHEVAQLSGRYVVMADYWRGGLHNVRGIALANRISEEIKKRHLEEDFKAIKLLLDANPDAMRYGLKAVTEEEYAKDRHFKANIAEPEKLLNGAFVRDRNGAYHPKGGGRVVIQDYGDSLLMKSRTKDSYSAAMELAISKGWTAIELKGSKRLMPEIWLEAKLKGLNVVNYKPTEKDLQALEKRLERQTGEMAKDLSKKIVPESNKAEHKAAEDRSLVESEMIEQPVAQSILHTFTDEHGAVKNISVTYELRYEIPDSGKEKFDNPKEAASKFVKQPGFSLPSVFKMTTRGDGQINETLIASTTEYRGRYKKELTKNIDAAFSKAMNEELVQEGLKPNIEHKNTSFSGMILDVDEKRNLVKQKTGRMHDDVAFHSLSELNSLGVLPKRDQSLTISYDNKGRAALPKEKKLEKAGYELSR